MRIVKNDYRGDRVWEYQGELIKRTSRMYLLRAYFNRSDLLFNGVLLRNGDEFLELYPLEKWFNIYEINDKESGVIKGWYCNISRAARITGDILEYDDLALDLLVYPDGNMLVLDQDEFSELRIPQGEVDRALQALEELKSIFSHVNAFDIRKFADML